MYIWKRHYNTHGQVSTKDARKVSILSGVLCCQIMLDDLEYQNALTCVTPRLCYNARAPPQKSEPRPTHIQIFGEKAMAKIKSCKNFCKKIFYVFSARTLYQLRLGSKGRAVRA